MGGGFAEVCAVGEVGQAGGVVGQAVGDQVDDLAFLLQAASDADQLGAHDGFAVAIEGFWPDDDIGDTGLVLQGGEDDAAGGAGALAHQHQPSHRDPGAVAGGGQIAGAGVAAAFKFGAEEAERVGL